MKKEPLLKFIAGLVFCLSFPLFASSQISAPTTIASNKLNSRNLSLVGSEVLARNTTVPAPAYGTLLIKGRAGVGQTDMLANLSKCESDPNTVYKRGSCVTINGQFKLNQIIRLPEGVYYTSYGALAGSEINNIIVRSGQQTTIEMGRIKVPLQSGTHFRVFQDLTNASELQKLLLGVWSNASSENIFGIFCLFETYSDLCTAIKSGPDAINGVIGYADDKARYYQLSVYVDGSGRYWESVGRYWVNNISRTGGFVSVFPGTYGVVFIDKDGIATEKYGIAVQ